MAVPHTIRLRGGKGHRDERIASGASKPGHLLKVTSANKVAVHDVYGGAAEKIFALEDSLQGNIITTAYADGDLVFTYEALPGDIINARVPAGAVSISNGDRLCSNGDGCLVKAVFMGSSMLYSNTAASNTVTNTNTETVFQVGGATIGYTIPAASLVAGDVIRVRGGGLIVGAANTDTIVVKVYLGSTAVLTSPTIDAVTNDIFEFDGDIYIRSVGNSGTYVAGGWFWNGTPAAAAGAADIGAGTAVGSTAINTNTTNLISVKVTISVVDTADQVRLDKLSVELLRSGNGVQEILAVAATGDGTQTLDNSAGTSETFLPVRIK
jgi:hypothetical protein